MKARDYFYRLGQKAASWGIPYIMGRNRLMPGAQHEWALDAFSNGYNGWSDA